MRLAVLAGATLLALLFGTLTPSVQVVSASPSNGGWWNNAYQFRSPVKVTNGGSSPLVNQTVILRLNFTGTDLENPLASVRLVDNLGNEVPSLIAGTRVQGMFVRSAYLLFTANLTPQTSQTFWVYYGSTLSTVPSYRSFGPAGTLTNGFMTGASVPLSTDSSQIRLGFGTADKETIVTKVSYGAGGMEDYGPSIISARPFSNDTGLISAGQLSSGAVVAYESIGAGSLQLTRIVILGPDGALTVDAVANPGGTVLSDVSLTSLIGLDGLATLGTSYSVYDPTGAVLYTQNPDAYFVVHQSIAAKSFALGTAASVISEAMKSSFLPVSSYSLASEAGFNWQLGTIQPLGSIWVSSSWSVAPDLGHSSPTLALPIGATLGSSEVLGIATPHARALWSATATLTNVAIPTSGLVVPLGTGNSEVVPTASSVVGTYLYAVPQSGASNPESWSSMTATTGNTTAYSSPQYYDFKSGKFVERVALHVPATGTGTVSLTSAGAFALGSTKDVFELSYRASFDVSSGGLSSQYFFVAADIAPAGHNNFTETVFFPVTGSSTTLSPGVCAPTGSFMPSPSLVISSGDLIGDNLWRKATVTLPNSLPSSGFEVRLRLCMSTSMGFSGGLNLEVGSAGIVSKGPVGRFVGASLSNGPSIIALYYLPQASALSPAGMRANLTITLVLQVDCNVSWADGSTFAGLIPPAPTLTIGGGLSRSAVLGNPQLVGVLVGSSVSGLAESGNVNGLTGSITAGPGTAFLLPGGSTNIVKPTPFSLGLRGQGFDVTVLDRAHVGVPGVGVSVSSNGVTIPVTVTTNSMGIAHFVTVPWTFRFNATYQGANVGYADAVVGAQSSASIQGDLYRVVLVVLDNRGGTIPGAQVNLGIRNFMISGVTNGQGRYTFDGVANSIYSLTVGVDNQSVFAGAIGATANNVLIQVTTTYVPSSTQILVAALLSVSSVIIVVAFYFVTRTRRF